MGPDESLAAEEDAGAASVVSADSLPLYDRPQEAMRSLSSFSCYSCSSSDAESDGAAIIMDDPKRRLPTPMKTNDATSW